MQGRIPPAGIVLARVTGGAIVFALIAWRRGVLRIPRGDLAAIVGCALIGVGANQELFVQGLSRSTATNASVLGATIPVFTALFAIVLGREPVRARRLAGIAIAFGGVAALVGVDRVSTDSSHVLGSAMATRSRWSGSMLRARTSPRHRAPSRARRSSSFAESDEPEACELSRTPRRWLRTRLRQPRRSAVRPGFRRATDPR
jgi:hypothetical protein